MVQEQFVNADDFFAVSETDYAGNNGLEYKFKLDNSVLVTDGTRYPLTDEPLAEADAFHIVSFNTVGTNTIGAIDRFPALVRYANDVGVSRLKIKVSITNQPDGLVVLETDGEDTADEFYYEGSQVFDLNGDLHDGNLQNQNTWAFYDNAQNNAYRSSQGLPASQFYGGNLALTTTGGTGDDAPFSVGDIVNVQQTNLSPTNPQYNGKGQLMQMLLCLLTFLTVTLGVMVWKVVGFKTHSKKMLLILVKEYLLYLRVSLDRNEETLLLLIVVYIMMKLN